MTDNDDLRTRRQANLELWERLFPTDPGQTKTFKRGGGFSGTAIKPMWMVMRATEEFGPIGQGWGWTELENKIHTLNDQRAVWFSKVLLWYRQGDEVHQVGPQWGATELVALRNEGKTLFMDEEAAKKAITDAVTKCLSYLGLAGDVHMGLFDDSKYVAERKVEERKERDAEAALERKEKREREQKAQEGAAQDTAKATGAKPADSEAIEDESQDAGDPADESQSEHFNPLAWLNRVRGRLAKLETPEEVLDYWQSQQATARQVKQGAKGHLADKAFELAKQRRDALRSSKAAE